MSEFIDLASSDETSSSGEWTSDDSDAGPAASHRASAASSGGTSTLPRGVMNGPPRGTLRLDRAEAGVGDVVGVYWEIPTVHTSAADWIGIYEKGIHEYMLNDAS